MPCDDVTELLTLTIDGEGRLEKYELFKRSCGRAVGERDLLLEQWRGMTAEDIMGLDSDAFAESVDTSDEAELVLTMKHFFAVQSGLRALTGRDSGGPFDPVRVAAVGGVDDGGLRLQAEVVVDVLTELIQSCGRCKGCGIKKLGK